MSSRKWNWWVGLGHPGHFHHTVRLQLGVVTKKRLIFTVGHSNTGGKFVPSLANCLSWNMTGMA